MLKGKLQTEYVHDVTCSTTCKQDKRISLALVNSHTHTEKVISTSDKFMLSCEHIRYTHILGSLYVTNNIELYIYIVMVCMNP